MLQVQFCWICYNLPNSSIFCHVIMWLCLYIWYYISLQYLCIWYPSRVLINHLHKLNPLWLVQLFNDIFHHITGECGFKNKAHHPKKLYSNGALAELKIVVYHRPFSSIWPSNLQFGRTKLLYISNGEAIDYVHG